eukprot:g48686.t1
MWRRRAAAGSQLQSIVTVGKCTVAHCRVARRVNLKVISSSSRAAGSACATAVNWTSKVIFFTLETEAASSFGLMP